MKKNCPQIIKEGTSAEEDISPEEEEEYFINEVDLFPIAELFIGNEAKTVDYGYANDEDAKDVDVEDLLQDMAQHFLDFLLSENGC